MLFFGKYHFLKNLLKEKKNEDYLLKTQFKNWTVNDVVGHLHFFNHAANLSLISPKKFENFYTPISDALRLGKNMLEIHRSWVDGLSGVALLTSWWQKVEQVTENYYKCNPKTRIEWVGPEMSAKSSISARQMETWAHGQEVFDVFGETRVEHDRIKNIVHLGVITFNWTFTNRNLSVPVKAPHVRLRSPTGLIWCWNEKSDISKIEGTAVDFARVVTQTRNVLDTRLKTTGKIAALWLSYAQCFAGPPEDPRRLGPHVGSASTCSESSHK